MLRWKTAAGRKFEPEIHFFCLLKVRGCVFFMETLWEMLWKRLRRVSSSKMFKTLKEKNTLTMKTRVSSSFYSECSLIHCSWFIQGHSFCERKHQGCSVKRFPINQINTVTSDWHVSIHAFMRNSKLQLPTEADGVGGWTGSDGELTRFKIPESRLSI